MPAHAYPPATISFPLYWPLLLALPVDRAANLGILLNVLLAGLAMFVCARRRLDHPLSALFCGVAYMLSYRYLAMIDAGWSAALTMYALAPLLFWSADRLLELPNRSRTAVFALILGLSAMQCTAQSFYYALLGLACLAAWRAPGLRPAARMRASLALAAGSAIALLLAAPDLLPRAQFAALSTRALRDYRFFLGDPPGLASLATLFDPRDAGGTRLEYWENNFYFGLWLYPLAFWACFVEWRKSLPLLLACAAGVLLCFDSPALRLLYRFLPGFSLFRTPSRILQLAQLPGRAAGRARRGRASPRTGPPARLCGGGGPVPAASGRLGRADAPAPAHHSPRRGPAAARLRGAIRRTPASGRVAALGRAVLVYGTAAYHDVDLVNGYAPLNLKHYIDYFSVLENGDAARTPAFR